MSCRAIPFFIAMAAVMSSCGGAVEAVHETDIRDELAEQGVRPASSQETPGRPAPPAVISSVTRSDLNALIEKGPPFVLAMVQVDSVLASGRFIGWRIVSFRTDAVEILGLKPEDVVVAVNGMPLERPEHIDAVYQKLKTDTRLVFDIRREGKSLQLVTPVLP